MATNPVVSNYDPLQAPLILGTVRVFGFAPGTKISVSRDEARKMKSVGVDGDVAYARNANLTGTMTISLQNTSRMNQILTAYTILEDSGADDVGFFNVLLTDPASGLSIVSPATIEEQPDFSLSQEVDQVDWVISLVDARLKPTGTISTVIESLTDLL